MHVLPRVPHPNRLLRGPDGESERPREPILQVMILARKPGRVIGAAAGAPAWT